MCLSHARRGLPGLRTRTRSLPVTVSRRGFLTYIGLGTYAALRDPLGAAPAPARRRGRGQPGFFDPITPSTDDRLLRSEEHTSELQSLRQLVCRLLLEKKNVRHPMPAHSLLYRARRTAARRPGRE